MTKKREGYYAVAGGRKVGVYRTWAECKEQVDGYPQAKYKRFDDPEAAVRFLNGEEPLLPPGRSDTDLVLITCANKRSGMACYGICAVYKGKYTFRIGMIDDPVYLGSGLTGCQTFSIVQAIRWGNELCGPRGLKEAFVYNADTNAVAQFKLSTKSKAKSLPALRRDMRELELCADFSIIPWKAAQQSGKYMRRLKGMVMERIRFAELNQSPHSIMAYPIGGRDI